MDRREHHIEHLRAIAIIAVVGYHTGLTGFSGGFVGVDVFFVMSGYLITGQLVRLKQAGTLDLLRFWLRRVARLAPAGVLMVLCTAVLGMVLLPPDRANQLAAAVGPSLAYTANLHFITMASDYHAGLTTLNPLLHMWSLGVEGQFYLLWPLVILIIPARWHLPVVLAFLTVSFMVSVAMTPGQPVFAFFGLPTRLWELAVGAGLALLGLRLPIAAGLAGLAMIGAAVLVFGTGTPFPGYTALLPVIGTALAIGGLRDWPSWAVLEWIGARSYSWYLWHWPLIIYAEFYAPGLASRLAAVALSLLLAEASYSLIEQPARRRIRQWATT